MSSSIAACRSTKLAAVTLFRETDTRHGDRSAVALIEFFTARIRNLNARMARGRKHTASIHWLGELGS